MDLFAIITDRMIHEMEQGEPVKFCAVEKHPKK